MLSPIGTLYRANKDGILPRTGVAPTGQLAALLERAVQDILDQDLANLTSILIRGSAARGQIDWPIADYDFVLLFDRDTAPKVNFTPSSLQGQDVEFLCLPRARFLSATNYARLRAFLAFCHWPLWGEDIAALLPDPKLDKDMLGHLPRLDHWFDGWQQDLASCKTPQARKEFCQWMMKRLVRSLLESLAIKYGAYSRDIYPCARFSSDHFPEAESDIMRAAELAVFPSDKAALISEIIHALTPLIQQRFVALLGHVR